MKKLVSFLLAVLMLVSVVPVVVSGANAYVINNVTVTLDDFNSSSGQCWDYANNVYKKIWGEAAKNGFSSLFEDENNCLKDLSDDQLLLNEENLKKFISFAPLGACLRICNIENLHSHDGPFYEGHQPGHNQIIVQKDANGFTVLEGGLTAYPHKQEKYYTWSGYCNTNWLGGRYGYIKYLKWPNAEKYKDEIKVGDIIEFGSYPQSEVKDEATINTLNSLAPTWDKWRSYDYYSGNGSTGSATKGDWMRFCDLNYNGHKYRGVKFNEYRTYYTQKPNELNNTNQAENGYNVGIIYWFIWEPIEWRVLDKETGLLMADKAVDSQSFANNYYGKGSYSDHYLDESMTIYSSDYANSSIRKWLIENFYYTAFSNKEQKNIIFTDLDNEAYSSEYSRLNSSPTRDKIFLLSLKEATNKSYGFSIYDEADSYRCATGTDYAKAQGLEIKEGNAYCWWLRTAGKYSYGSTNVQYRGHISWYADVCFSDVGVRPALRLNNLDVNAPCKHINSVNKPQIDSNCIDIGFTAGVYCNDCETWLSGHEVIAVGDHKDSTGDGKCDTCLKTLSTPNEPEGNFITKIINVIKNIIQKILSIFNR